MKRSIAQFAVALACFFALDACWLSLMGPRLYRPALDSILAPEVDWTAAATFYAVYVGGLVAFVIQPATLTGRASRAFWRGALFGMVAFATYDLTNQATIVGWPWVITGADLVWGAFASGVACVAAAAFALRWPLVEGGQGGHLDSAA